MTKNKLKISELLLAVKQEFNKKVIANKSKYSGLCSVVNYLYETDIITKEDKDRLNKYILINTPKTQLYAIENGNVIKIDAIKRNYLKMQNKLTDLTWKPYLFAARNNWLYYNIKTQKEIEEKGTDKERRNNQIYQDYLNGLKGQAIIDKYGLAKTTINNIITKMNGGLTINQAKRKKREHTISQIKHDMNVNNLNYYQIKEKYNLDINAIHRLNYYGLDLNYTKEIEKRNKFLSKKYLDGATAKSLTCNTTKMCITSLSGIYQVLPKKFPKIKRNTKDNYAKGTFIDKRAKYIIKREVGKKTSYNKIADILNKKGYKTATGKNFSIPLVNNYIVKLKKVGYIK